jgi:hypothetical protein
MAKLRTYKAYSLGCVVVWGVVLIVAGATSGDATFSSFLLVAGGWWLGWLSATIARAVYRRCRHARPLRASGPDSSFRRCA